MTMIVETMQMVSPSIERTSLIYWRRPQFHLRRSKEQRSLLNGAPQFSSSNMIIYKSTKWSPTFFIIKYDDLTLFSLYSFLRSWGPCLISLDLKSHLFNAHWIFNYGSKSFVLYLTLSMVGYQVLLGGDWGDAGSSSGRCVGRMVACGGGGAGEGDGGGEKKKKRKEERKKEKVKKVGNIHI